MRKPYMLLRVTNEKIKNYMSANVPRNSYRHLVKSECVRCGERTPDTLTYYEANGNFCEVCTSKYKSRKLSEEELNLLFRGQSNQLYEDLYQDTRNEEVTPDVIQRVRKELGLS